MTDQQQRHELVVDRFEGEVVVVEIDGSGTVDLPRWMLPAELREGDVVLARIEGARDRRTVECTVDAEETKRRRDRAGETVERLRARDPGGDITL